MAQLFIKVCNVLVLYSERAVALQVVEVLGDIQAAIHNEPPLNICLWRFDVLQEPGSLAAASQDVVSADMIVASLNDERRDWNAFQSWAKNWPEGTTDKPRALVYFQWRNAQRQIPRKCVYQESLRILAARKKMDFITNESAIEFKPHRQAVDGHIAYGHCGINE